MDYVTVSRFHGIGGALLFASKPGSNPAGSCTLSTVLSECPNILEVARTSLKWTDPAHYRLRKNGGVGVRGSIIGMRQLAGSLR